MKDPNSKPKPKLTAGKRLPRRNRALAAVLAALTALAFAACAAPAAQSDTLTLTVIDVGRADALLVQCGGTNLLIDAGSDNDFDDVAAHLDALHVASLDCLITTHYDKDHIGGAPALLQYIDTARIVQPVYPKDDAKAYTRYLEAVAECGAQVTDVSEDTTLTFDGFTVDIVAAKGDYTAEKEFDNHYSLVCFLRHGDNTFLLPGDIEGGRITELLAERGVSCDFLKQPHHGDWDEQTGELINAARPAYAAVTCSDKYPPSDKTISALAAAGAKVYTTQNGTITAVSDGKAITVSQQ